MAKRAVISLREQSIFLLSLSFTRQIIGTMLFISTFTVKTHMNNIGKRFNIIRTRTVRQTDGTDGLSYEVVERIELRPKEDYNAQLQLPLKF